MNVCSNYEVGSVLLIISFEVRNVLEVVSVYIAVNCGRVLCYIVIVYLDLEIPAFLCESVLYSSLPPPPHAVRMPIASTSTSARMLNLLMFFMIASFLL